MSTRTARFFASFFATNFSLHEEPLASHCAQRRLSFSLCGPKTLGLAAVTFSDASSNAALFADGGAHADSKSLKDPLEVLAAYPAQEILRAYRPAPTPVVSLLDPSPARLPSSEGDPRIPAPWQGHFASLYSMLPNPVGFSDSQSAIHNQ